MAILGLPRPNHSIVLSLRKSILADNAIWLPISGTQMNVSEIVLFSYAKCRHGNNQSQDCVKGAVCERSAHCSWHLEGYGYVSMIIRFLSITISKNGEKTTPFRKILSEIFRFGVNHAESSCGQLVDLRPQIWRWLVRPCPENNRRSFA